MRKQKRKRERDKLTLSVALRVGNPICECERLRDGASVTDTVGARLGNFFIVRHADEQPGILDDIVRVRYHVAVREQYAGVLALGESKRVG